MAALKQYLWSNILIEILFVNMAEIQSFQLLKQKIAELQNLLLNAMMKNSEISDDRDFIIQEQLDSLDYYIKWMPKDKYVLFRWFSDALYFSQSRFMEVKASLSRFIQRNSLQIDKLLKEMESDRHSLDIVTDLIFLCEIYKWNLNMIYYDKSLSIKTGTFVLNSEYSYINLSLLTPAKVETFYSKDFISKAGMCQAILSDIIDKIGKKEETDDSFVEIKYQFYK